MHVQVAVRHDKYSRDEFGSPYREVMLFDLEKQSLRRKKLRVRNLHWLGLLELYNLSVQH